MKYNDCSAEWQSGHAADCNSVNIGSIPFSASNSPGGEIGRHKGLKIPRRKLRAGSSPALGTIKNVFYKSIAQFKFVKIQR